MAVALLIEFPEGTQASYDKILENLGTERYSAENLPQGLVCHIAFPSENGWTIVAVWESREDFERFLQGRLMPVLSRSGLSRPNVKEYPVYNLMLGVRSPERVPMIGMVA